MQQSIKIKSFLYLLIILLLSSFTKQLQAEQKRFHKAHTHGIAKLNIALEKDSTLTLEFEIPAMDVVEFEHQPKNKEQDRKIRQAVLLLKDTHKVLELSKAAGCSIKRVNVKAPGFLDDDHAHDKDHHSHDEKESEKDEDGHSEFHAEYEFKCLAAKRLSEIELYIFKHFPSLTVISAVGISDKGHSFRELTPKSMVFDASILSK